MHLPRPKPQAKPEAIVPMINVVFLLLVFFMMTSQIAPPAPFEMSPPNAAPEAPADRTATLYISANGEMEFEGANGDAVWLALAQLAPDQPLTIAADAALPVAELARIIGRLDPDLSVHLLVQP